MTQYDIIIIGAGISGLSMAHYCAGNGLKTLVIEKDKRIGGCLHSHRLDGKEVDFWIELGAHTCFNSYGNLLEILEDQKILNRLLKRERLGYRLLVDGRMKSIPSQLHYLELLFSLPRLFFQKKAGQSVAAYYTKIAGRRNFQKLFSAAFDAVICQQAATFPADLLFKRKPRRKDVMRSFTTPGGLQSIAETIARQAGMDLMTGQEIQVMTFSNNGFVLTTSAGKQYEARHLCIATPVSTASRLLKAPFPELAKLLARIRIVSVETVGVAVHKDALCLPPLAGIIAVDDRFFSAVSRDTVSHTIYRGFTFHFKPGLLDYNEKIARICEVLGVRTEQLESICTEINLLPALSAGHAELIGEVDRHLAGKPLALTGNYFAGISIEECVSRSLSEFNRLIGQVPSL